MNSLSSNSANFFNFASMVAYVVLFPGFIFYQYSVAAGWTTPFAGGLFGFASVFFSFISVIYLLSADLKHTTLSIIETVFPLFLLYLVLWTVFSSFSILGESYATLALKESFATIVIWLSAFYVGVQFPLNNHRFRLIQAILILVILACVLHSMLIHHSFLGLFSMFSGGNEDTKAVATYQGIGRSLVVMAVLTMALTNRLFFQIVIISVAITILLALGSRAHLIVMTLLLVIHLVIYSTRKHNIRTSILFLIILPIVAYSAISVLLETRAAEIFDLSHSMSWQARITAHYEALEVIGANPLIGRFGYYLGDSSGYAHNVLSAWTEYGFFGFIIFIGLMLYALFLSGYYVIFKRNDSTHWQIAFHFNFIALFLAVTTEPILASVFPALGWGFTVQAIRQTMRSRTFFRTTA